MKFVSWNLGLLERSAQAPGSIQRFHIEDAIRREMLELQPDIVCWQELPNQVPFVETLDLMQATTQSHSGRLATLIAKDSPASTCEPTIKAVDGAGLLSTFPEHDGRPAVTIGNVHLEAGKGAVGFRLDQLGNLVEQSPTERLLIVGDTNTRVDEIEFIENAGFSCPKPPRATWNSKKNRFRHGGAEFTAYFTRVFASPGIELGPMTVHDTPANVNGAKFFWSDHFALSGTFDVLV